MKKSLAIALFLSASMNAYAVDSGAVFGGAIGGAAGAAVGYNMGGQNGAILGAALGGATGAAIGSKPSAPVVQAAPVQVAVPVAQYDEEDHHKHEKNRGHQNKHDRRD